jgi:Tfp pilus assembly protein PilN
LGSRIEMRAVNLLPHDEKQPRLEGGRIPLLLAAGGVAAVTAGAFLLASSVSGTADERRAELAAIEAAIAQVPKPPGQALDEGVLAQERTDRVAALSAALTTRFSFDKLLREISFVLPQDAWLTGLKAGLPAAAAPQTGAPSASSSPASQDVSIEGATYSHDSVALILSRLSVVPSLENVSLTATARVEPQPTQASTSETTTSKKSRRSGTAKKVKKKKVVVTFTIAASLRPGGS